MAVYAVGDIHGCLEPLKRLLDRVVFDTSKDILWLVGDLVNRGPSSLETIRYLYSIKESIICVLGNHDLHLLAVSHDSIYMKKKDTLKEILDAPDCFELIQWIRSQPLLHYDSTRNIALVHAGIPPQWNIQQAIECSKQVQEVLVDDSLMGDFFDYLYEKKDSSRKSIKEIKRLQYLKSITDSLTRIRFCTAKGVLDLRNKKSTSNHLLEYAPWFSHKYHKTRNIRIIFGHWAALQGNCNISGIFALDTGCVWGGYMSILNVDSEEVFTFP